MITPIQIFLLLYFSTSLHRPFVNVIIMIMMIMMITVIMVIMVIMMILTGTDTE